MLFLFKCFSLAQFCFDQYLSFLWAFVPIVLRHILKAIWKSTRWSKHFCMFFFIGSEVSICVLEKMLLEFLEQPSISISKYSFEKNFGKLPIKHPFWSPLFEYRPSRREKGHSPSEDHVHFRCAKRSTSKKF